MKQENIDKLRELGADRFLYYVDNTPHHRVKMPEVKHFFANGVEVAILFFEQTSNENLFIFPTPRVWDRSFLRLYEAFDF